MRWIVLFVIVVASALIVFGISNPYAPVQQPEKVFDSYAKERAFVGSHNCKPVHKFPAESHLSGDTGTVLPGFPATSYQCEGIDRLVVVSDSSVDLSREY